MACLPQPTEGEEEEERESAPVGTSVQRVLCVQSEDSGFRSDCPAQAIYIKRTLHRAL
jgi:hypothetical protein